MEILPIVVEQSFKNSTESIWKAIITKDQMTQWFFENIPDFKPEVGFSTQFLVENEGRQFTHLWKIVEVIHLKRITYDWSYKEYNGKGMVCFELFEEADNTKLRITNFGIETFPKNIPEFSRESCKSGWNYFINRLHLYLNKM